MTNKKDIESNLNQAALLCQQGRLSEAKDIYEHLIEFIPNNENLLTNLGTIYLYDTNLVKASELLNRSILINKDPLAMNNLATVYINQKKYPEALEVIEETLRINNIFDLALYNKGICLSELDLNEAACEAFRRALEVNPKYVEAYVNLGANLNRLGKYHEALDSLNHSIALSNNYSEAFYNRGVVYQNLKKYSHAMNDYDRAIKIKPSHAKSYFNKAIIYLTQGDYDLGFKFYEWRVKLENYQSKKLINYPIWLGDKRINRKSILITSEQGLGDIILMSRYINLLKKEQAKVILLLPKPLLKLFKSVFIDVQFYEDDIQDLPLADYTIPIMSLPFAFKTLKENIPEPATFKINNEEHKNILKEFKFAKMKVGIVWSGGFREGVIDGEIYRRKSIPLNLFKKLKDLDITFVSLQKGKEPLNELREAQAMNWGGPEIFDMDDHINDFYDTASIINSLDLVITVCTSVAHLSASMNKPTWILNPYISFWLWLDNKKDSMWYPTVRLFRQPEDGDWDSVINEVYIELNKLTSSNLS